MQSEAENQEEPESCGEYVSRCGAVVKGSDLLWPLIPGNKGLQYCDLDQSLCQVGLRGCLGTLEEERQLPRRETIALDFPSTCGDAHLASLSYRAGIPMCLSQDSGQSHVCN